MNEMQHRRELALLAVDVVMLCYDVVTLIRTLVYRPRKIL